MSSRSPHYFVLSSPSGGGKTTILRSLLHEQHNLKLSVSCTTRLPRPGEVSGTDYYFVSEIEFRDRVSAGQMLEWEEVHGFLYGTPQSELDGVHQGLLFDVDTKGALRLKELFPETTLIFICPPSLDVLKERLQSRGTEDPIELQRRLNRFQMEMAEKDKFDYVIINDEVETAVSELKMIIDEKTSE